MPVAEAESLALFHPVIESWFRSRLGEPTEIQHRAWPEIAQRHHVLVTAPTGSGKTLTAFLWALDRLLTGAWETGRLRVLYVSPLKALNNDVQRNLLGPLAELESAFAEAGAPVPEVRVVTRSGDTPSRERQRMIRRPPEILITTPESLNILLTSRGGRSILGNLRTVILDEIHAVAGSKRGTHLATAVERLVPLAGEFQRLALSATVRPAERVARFVGGYETRELAGSIEHRPRPVRIVRTDERKSYEIRVVAPSPPPGKADGSLEPGEDAGKASSSDEETQWDALVRAFKDAIAGNRSTLIFANSRRATEKLTRLINEGETAEVAYSHHGSLSREIRSVVEQRLKDGRLSAIVATSSLELGIDIGSLDEVLLLATPPTVTATIQRIGRSGHGVGEKSRARLYPFFERDFLDAAVMARCVLENDLEEVEPVRAPLDVLAQVILSAVATEAWRLDELFEQIRSSDPYHRLPRRQFDLVVEMLAGRYADSRIRELQPQISIDRIDGTVRGRRGAAHRVYMGGGTIPDRGYFQLRLEDGRAKLGELDEEFVWERSIGDTFSLGTQTWRIRKITHNDVLVVPAYGGAAMAPFWRAEARNRSFHLSERIGRFLETADEILDRRAGGEQLARALVDHHCLEPAAAAALVALLETQRAQAGAGLPHRRRILVERVHDERVEPGRQHVILHTFWGGRVNRPWVTALAEAWEERHAYPLEADSENDCVIVTVPSDFDATELFELVRPDNLEALLRRRLESTGLFGANFRENAGRALLLPRSDLRRRVPLWLQRERAKKLYETVARYEDFPVVVETWRSCLRDGFDLDSLRTVLNEVEAGEIVLDETSTTTPTPFAGNLVWKQTNRLMYEDDVSDAGRSAVRGDLLEELVFSSELRPRIPAEILDEFEAKLKRLWPGYAPRSADELVDWAQERIWLPDGEWRALLAAMAAMAVGEESTTARDGALGELLGEASRRIVRLELPGDKEASGHGAPRGVCALETLPRLLRALGLDLEEARILSLDPTDSNDSTDSTGPPADPRTPLAEIERAIAAVEPPSRSREEDLALLVSEWARFCGPFPAEELERVFGLEPQAAAHVLARLTEERVLVVDRFREPENSQADAPHEVCDTENVERLLRLLRARSRPEFRALSLEKLPLFFALHQGLAVRQDGVEGLQQAFERLFGYPAPARLWETDLLPARLDPYYPAWLDSLLQETDLGWAGCGKEKTTFVFPEDASLLREDPDSEETGSLPELFPEPRGRFGFEDLLEHTGLGSAELARRLWAGVWRGEVSNTGYQVLRRGLLNRFEPVEIRPVETDPRPAPRRLGRGGRARFDRWRSSRPFVGDWFLASGDAESFDRDLDAIDREELNRERVRLVLDRYGVVFRELLARELPVMSWSRLFRTLRIMELSGEVLAGHFFDGLPGPQFASRSAFRQLKDGLPEDPIFWMSAVDPASPSGLGVEALRGRFPARRPSTHLVFHGSRLVVVSKRGGGELEIGVAPDHPHLAEYLGFLKNPLTRQFAPVRSIDVERINEQDAAGSPYRTALDELFSVTRERGGLRLRRRYRPASSASSSAPSTSRS